LHNAQLPIMLGTGNANLLVQLVELASDLDEFAVCFGEVNDGLDGFGHDSFSYTQIG